MSKPWQNSRYCLEQQQKLTYSKYKQLRAMLSNMHVDIVKQGGYTVSKLADLHEQLAMICLYYEMEHGLLPF